MPSSMMMRWRSEKNDYTNTRRRRSMYAAASACRPGREPGGREAKGSTLSTFLLVSSKSRRGRVSPPRRAIKKTRRNNYGNDE